MCINCYNPQWIRLTGNLKIKFKSIPGVDCLKGRAGLSFTAQSLKCLPAMDLRRMYNNNL
ncbi:MAG TPA: hypothetical protein VNV85_09540 [Puia sp.]|nr:hypothetical protein [Puia sp.]